jgi:uncharacterized protein YndB with AHSA1/START domain
MLKKILFTLTALLALLLLYAAARPDTFRVERRILIQAPPEKVWAELGDLRRWQGWSPWERMDPQMKRSYSTPSTGRGATYAWEGNTQVGQGRMAIVEADAPARLVIKLDFIQPFEAHNTAEFTLMPQAGATEVSWVMRGPNTYVGKLMQVFVDMDQMVGRDFETGLANLKTLAEQ